MKIVSAAAILCIFFNSTLHGQNISPKKVVDNTTYRTWETLKAGNSYDISANGKWVYYQYGSEFTKFSLVVTSTSGTHMSSFENATEPVFTDDSKNMICKLSGDTLLILSLEEKKSEFIKGVKEFMAFQSLNRSSLAMIKNNDLIIKDLAKGTEKVFSNVQQFYLNKQKDGVLFRCLNTFFWWNFLNSRLLKIADLPNPEKISFEASGKGIAFLAVSKFDDLQKERRSSIYYYELGYKQARKIAGDDLEHFEHFKIDERYPLKFSSNGKYICFRITAIQEDLDHSEIDLRNRMKLWHYKTLTYLSDQTVWGVGQSGIACISLHDSDNVPRIIDTGYISVIGEIGPDYLLIKKYLINDDDVYWNADKKPAFTLKSLKDGRGKLIVPRNHDLTPHGYPLTLSADAKFVTWEENETGDIFTYEIATGRLRNATAKINIPKDLKWQNNGSRPHRFAGVCAWLKNDAYCLVADKYDLWKVDPLCVQTPVNLTKGYGRANKIKFAPAASEGLGGDDDLLVLRAMDMTNINNGFWTVSLKINNSLRVKCMDPCLYSWQTEYPELRKAKYSDVYLITKQTANDAPNLFVTKDLKSFKAISNIHPQHSFKWLNSELVNYPMNGGKTGRGILYKPDDFDSRKRYPVIFNYYQERSSELHLFHNPRLNCANIDIPWYVTHDYLVFVPDIINDCPGMISQTVVNSVESAVDYLARCPWFDTTKMGLQGQSFGGYETNILIANSRRFAAAQSVAGISDVIGGAFGTSFNKSALTMYEKGQQNFNATIWEHLEIYIKNSPILKADKITTPLFIQHNRKDDPVPFYQEEALFYALRRLKKPVWLIEYESGGHTGPGSLGDKEDFITRQQQFFNHYLKGCPMPQWMIDGSLSLRTADNAD